jgi:[protein-PII] uridylyltransferase
VTTEVRRSFERARSHVEEWHRSGVPASQVVRQHTDDVDAIVISVFETAIEGAERDTSGLALVALGGYGRRELAPNSDLDLLLLYRGWSSSDATRMRREVMYPLYDSRRELGDRIREPRDVLRDLDQIDEVCALLDARLLAGDAGVFADMQATVGRRLERSRASFFRNLMQASAHRHHRYGHVGHLLEPNIRDSAGGLRDVHTLGWASKVLPGSDGLSGLVEGGHLSEFDAALVVDATEYMLRLRIELHLITGRHQDQLYLAEQDELARRLDYEAVAGRPAADRLMQELFAHTRQADAVIASFWDRVSHQGRRRRWRSASSENIGDGCVIQHGRLEVVATTNASEDPSGWLRVFRRSVLRDVHIGRSSLNRLIMELIDAPSVSWSSEARDIFLDILQSGSAGIRALEEMDLSGFLVALIPEWAPIRAFPQRDLYHRYSVDRHLFATVAELAASRNLDERDVRDAWSNVGDPDAVFVAALLHDIGKGRAGDHSEIGAELARTAATRMGLGAAQVEDVVFLVRGHLVLAEAAIRRDLNDPKTIGEITERVGDERRLAMLYLLTRADSLATGAEAWSSFRSSLVRELYGRARGALAGQPPVVDASASKLLAELAASLDLSREEAARLIGPMPESWIVGLDSERAARQINLLRTPLAPHEVRTSVHHVQEADEFVLVAPDRPGLFSTVAGVLALRGFDVHDAEIYTRSDGVAIEAFRVIGRHGAVPEDRWIRLAEDITSALSGDFDVDAALSKKATQARQRRSHRRRDPKARIVVDNAGSQTHTIVEVHTEDRLGLLRTITKALTDAGCDLSVAKVATYGADVVDVFYVHDIDGHQITDPEDVRRIHEGLHRALGTTDQ